MEYTVNDILEFIIDEFDLHELWLIELDGKDRLKQYIQNKLSKEKIPFVRQEEKKQGKPKIYNQESIDLLMEKCGKYFASLSTSSDEQKREVLNNYAKYKRIEQELNNPPRSTEKEVLKGFMSPEISDEEHHAQLQIVEFSKMSVEIYEKRKYQIMLEALFNDRFQLNNNNLINDIKNEVTHLVYDSNDAKIIRSLERLENSKNYYKLKKDE